MRIVLINPPHRAIGSRMPREHLPPLGLLAIGGPLVDLGHAVTLLDADYDNLPYDQIVTQALEDNPDLVLMGHSGSTSAQPIINDIAQLIRSRNANTQIIIGGVFPTYHWQEILEHNPQIDYVACGEGEQVVCDLDQTEGLSEVRGIAYRSETGIVQNPGAELITDLDRFRIGWELMGDYHYTYWGKKKAVVIQFSRGCPYPCNYCGQSLFWKKFRTRDSQKLADEIEMLHRTFGIEVINFADENPSSVQKPWIAFLEALIAKNLDLILVGSIRADNIVRDAPYLHLYKRAGFERFLLGIENYDEAVLARIKKAGSVNDDQKAIQLLRQHDILSMATYVVGFGDETVTDFFRALKHLLRYDPDQIQLMYVTPHKWTPYFDEIADRNIIQTDQRKWDYKHQVLESTNLKPWQVLACVKAVELLMQTRPKAIIRWLFHRDRGLRKAMFWYNNIGKRVWFYELYQFFFDDKVLKKPVKFSEFWR